MATNANAGENTPGGSPAKIEFTAEQQAKVNELIQEAMGRAGREAKVAATTAQTELTKVQTELAQAQEALKAASTPADKKDAAKDVAALQAEMARVVASHTEEVNRFKTLAQKKEEEARTATQKVIDVQKQVAIGNAASKVNFVNNEVVATLTKDNVKWDSDKNKFIVVGDNGEPRMNSSFEPMSLEEFYTEFAAKNPYLVRGDVRTGTGSSESRRDVTGNGKFEIKQIFGRESNAALANKLALENPAEYQRLKKVAQSSGLI